tara:strand:- start:136 stop:411 length:276 start_codon:yes stop_codon:yes gene_type:complete
MTADKETDGEDLERRKFFCCVITSFVHVNADENCMNDDSSWPILLLTMCFGISTAEPAKQSTIHIKFFSPPRLHLILRMRHLIVVVINMID